MKIGIYSYTEYRSCEFLADVMHRMLRDDYIITRDIKDDVDLMLVINGVPREETASHTAKVDMKMLTTPTIYFVDDKRCPIPNYPTITVYSQYKDAVNYFQLSEVALWSRRFNNLEFNSFDKHYDFVYWGHRKEGRGKYEDEYCIPGPKSLLIGEWGTSVEYITNLTQLYSDIHLGRSTIIFGDRHDNKNNMPLRIYEALMCGVVPYFDEDFLPDTPFTVSKLSDIPRSGSKEFDSFVKWFLPDGVKKHREYVKNKLLEIIEIKIDTVPTGVMGLLNQRATIYGSYANGVEARGKMMDALDNLHYERHGEAMPFDLQIMLGDILLKVMRAVQDPMHLDSWVDLEGYANLIKQEFESRGAK